MYKRQFDLSLPLLAGCSDRTTLLKDLGEELSSVLMSPGCAIQSLAASAREAWIKLYKATTASRDSQISYYRLGAAVAFCLDVRLRQRGHSMAAILRELWQGPGRQARGYSRDHIKAAVARWDRDLASDLDQWLDQPEAVPLLDCVKALGLRMDPVPLKHPDHGLTLKDADGAALIQRVRRDSPGQQAGLVVGDELLAINGYRVRRSSDLAVLLEKQECVRVTYSRRSLLKETQLFPDAGVDHWTLDWDPGCTTEQRQLRDRWFEIV